MDNFTFAMIKPDAVRTNYVGKIIDRILHAGFCIRAMKLVRLSKKQAEQFYAVHSERPFFNELTTFMSSGSIYALLLEKDNAVPDFRKLIGATNPAEAEDGTIRKEFAHSIEKNAIHGSDSDENAEIETRFFFNSFEIT